MSFLPDEITQPYLTAIEHELQEAVKHAGAFGNGQFYKMLAYHLGWQGRHLRNETRGKRIRPLIVLFSSEAAGGDWNKALPAAAAVELVHNFSLIHDDIEDHSPYRRGRRTLWKKWGIAQAINAGDAMFTLAHLQTVRLSDHITPEATLKAVETLQQACLKLTQGQYLDLSYEKRNDVTIDEYWSMVEGKTAALVSASSELGAISAAGDEQTCYSYRKFGYFLGLAFQVQDDYLGLWGDSSITGKSNQSDLITRKKTLPILFGLSNRGNFADRWMSGPIKPEETKDLIKLLEYEGGKIYILDKASELIEQALKSLDEAHPKAEESSFLRNLTVGLIQRQS